MFAALAVLIVGAAALLLQPKELAVIEFGPSPSPSAIGRAAPTPAGSGADLTLRIDMAGFTPPELVVPAGRAVRLRIVNPDNSHHTDGGGVHGFTVPALGIDVKVQPLSTGVLTLPPAAVGDYSFYCDTCCGGKENPSMQGWLRVRA